MKESRVRAALKQPCISNAIPMFSRNQKADSAPIKSESQNIQLRQQLPSLRGCPENWNPSAGDRASNIQDIYKYATALDAEGKYFEMKIYQGQPHGFMIENIELSQSFAAKDAYWQMMTFFKRTLK
jgi:dienelactone hydrolase